METIGKPMDRAIVATICGDAGTGKTSLAATFPNPIFIRAEDGMQSIPEGQRPDAFPVLKDVAQIWDQLIALLQSEHSYQTLVIDSVTALEALFVQDVLDRDKRARSINQAFGGYGAGPGAVATMHRRVRKAAGLLNVRKGMHVVFVAHAEIETMRLPDSDDYMRYSLRLPAKSLPPYIDDVDLVGFVKLVSIVRGEDGERKKATSTGDRELIVAATAANVSKNRFGIVDSLDFVPGINPLGGLVPGLPAPVRTGPTKAKKPAADKPTTDKPAADVAATDGDVIE